MAAKPKPVNYDQVIADAREIADSFTNKEFVDAAVKGSFPHGSMRPWRDDLKKWMGDVGADLTSLVVKLEAASKTFSDEFGVQPEPEEEAEAPAAEGEDDTEPAAAPDPVEDDEEEEDGDAEEGETERAAARVEVPS